MTCADSLDQSVTKGARQLRQAPTLAEERLWEQLRDRRVGGYRFRQQHPHGPFIFDLYCAEARLIVEVDGAVHLDPQQQQRDNTRDDMCRSQGLHILRISNDEVSLQLEAVLARILATLDAAGTRRHVRSPNRYRSSSSA